MKNNLKIYYLMAVGVALLLAGIYYWSNRQIEMPEIDLMPEQEMVACTMDAKICPDGSAVGRQGPNCEFAACPSVASPRWLNASLENGLSFEYPESLGTEYISAQAWPAEAAVVDKAWECLESGDELRPGGRTAKKLIADKEYCVTQASEGAAGSVYSTYTYAFAVAQKTVSFKLVLRSVQCSNYDEAQMIACENERASFDLDALVDRMARSVQVK